MEVRIMASHDDRFIPMTPRRILDIRARHVDLFVYLLCLFDGITLAFAVLVLSERPAFAYTDPGSGALIWQMLTAGFIGLAFYFRRLLTWFKQRRTTKSRNSNRQVKETKEHSDDNAS
jgi:hypothetical protein